MRQYVIIGGGVAAVGCVEGIRSLDREAGITMLSSERRPVYCRPLISYYLQGKTDFEKMKYRPDDFYEENNCDVIYAKAQGIDAEAKTVLLDEGQTVAYDELCVATGSSPFVPLFSGIDTVEHKQGFMTEDDAVALESSISPSSRVLIIGAGLIGLKCAEGICERVQSVTVCDLSARVLSSILDDTCASMMQKKLEEHGVAFILQDSVERFDKATAFMKSGKTVDFDILVIAVGVLPNISLIKSIGGECDRGIIIDTAMKTSIDSIYAAGDCAQGYDASIEKKRVLAIMPNAYMQGRCAGINMAGGDTVVENAIPMNAIGFFGLHALTAGSYAGDMIEAKSSDYIKRLFIKDGRLTGFMMVGVSDGAGIYTSLIREKVPVDKFKPEILMENPRLVAFSSEKRGKILGGVV